MPGDDPWNWSNDDLVRELCVSRNIYSTARCSEPYPDPENLEQQLRVYRITGSVFLTALDPQMLRHDLKISSLGESTALASVMRFLQSQSSRYKQHTATTGIDSLSIHPHRPDDVPTGVPVSDEISRKRRRATTEAPGEWDHLLRWAQTDTNENVDIMQQEDRDWAAEELVDVDDFDNDITAGAVEEDGQDFGDEGDIQQPYTQGRRRSKLSEDEIINVINASIEEYTNAWTPGKDEITEDLGPGELVACYDPEQLWTEAEDSGQRQDLARRYESQARYLQQRLDELCREIVLYAGTNTDAVRKQCSNLEVTVDSLEHANWLASIYNLDPEDDSDEDSNEDRNSVEEVANLDATQTPKPRPGALPEVIDLDSLPDASELEYGHSAPSQSSILPPEGNRLQDSAHRAVRSMNEVDRTVVPTSAGSVQGPQGDAPENASIVTVRRWRWGNLVEMQDRKRVVSKAVHEIDSEKREMIRIRLRILGRVQIIREIIPCVDMLVRGDTRMPGVLPRDSVKIIALTTLFLCWGLCENCFQKTPTQGKLKELAQRLDQDYSDLDAFCEYLNTILTTTFSPDAVQRLERPPPAEAIVISDDEEDTLRRPVKRRKSLTAIPIE
jgi:hypothetical protein